VRCPCGRCGQDLPIDNKKHVCSVCNKAVYNLKCFAPARGKKHTCHSCDGAVTEKKPKKAKGTKGGKEVKAHEAKEALEVKKRHPDYGNFGEPSFDAAVPSKRLRK